MTWNRVVRALAGLVVVASVAAACGADATVAQTTSAAGQAGETVATPASADAAATAAAVPAAVPEPTAAANRAGSAAADDEIADADTDRWGCPVNATTVEAAVGAEIVDLGLWGSGNTATGLAANGCSYETTDGTRYVIALATLLDDPQGSPSLVFDELLARGNAITRLATLGDAAFLVDESLFVADEGVTFVVEVIGASLDVNDLDLLRQLAESILALDGFDARCTALPTLTPDEWQPGTDVLRGGGASDTPSGGFTFDLCQISIAAVPGATVSLRSSDEPTWFDAERQGASGVVTLVEGLGAEVVHVDDDLIVRLGDRVLVINGEDAVGDELDPAASTPLLDLARAVIEAR